MRTDELLMYCVYMKTDVVWEHLVQPKDRLAAPTTQPTTMTTRSTSAMKTTCTGRSPTHTQKKNTSVYGLQTKTAVTATLVALTTWMMQGVAEKWLTVLNHSNGPFQDQHLFKKDDLIMFNVGSCQLLPYQINPVQNKHYLS